MTIMMKNNIPAKKIPAPAGGATYVRYRRKYGSSIHPDREETKTGRHNVAKTKK